MNKKWNRNIIPKKDLRGCSTTLTYDRLKSIIEDVMFNPQPTKSGTIEPPLFKKLPEDFDLDFQIQNGYMYSIEGELSLWTGAGGIRDIIKKSREIGLPDVIIAQDIYISDYTGKVRGTYWIGDVVWKKIEKS